MSNSYFAAQANARTIEPRTVPRRRTKCPLVIIGGPADLSPQESLCLSDALKERHANVEVFRVTPEFRIEEFIAALGGCSWFLLAIGEFPGRELEMLREAQRITTDAPKIGIICLKDRVQTSSPHHVGGRVDLIVRKTHLDQSLVSHTRTNHLLIAESLLNEDPARSIARIVVPDHVFNAFR